jgi:hypothetical protein
LQWIEGLLDFSTPSFRAESCFYVHLSETVLEIFTITRKSSKLKACPSRGFYTAIKPWLGLLMVLNSPFSPSI